MNRNAAPPPGMSGFTVIELMVVVAILGILLALAAPSFSGIIEKQRVKSAAADLHASLTRTRSEALKRNTNMTLSPKGGSWSNGWLVADPVTAATIEDHDSFTGLTISGPSSITYRSSGRISGTANASFGINGSHSSTNYCVQVDLSGRPAVKASACS